MDLDSLVAKTNQKSISEMSDVELHEHLRIIRQSRLVTKGPSSSTMKERVPKKIRETKEKSIKTVISDPSKISPSKLDELADLFS